MKKFFSVFVFMSCYSTLLLSADISEFMNINQDNLQEQFQVTLYKLLNKQKRADYVEYEAMLTAATFFATLAQPENSEILAQIDPCKSMLYLTKSKKGLDLIAMIYDDITSESGQIITDACSVQNRIKLFLMLDNFWTLQERRAITSKAGVRGERLQIETIVKELDTSKAEKYINADLKNGEFALTFDDGPHPSHTRVILDILKDTGAKVNFFVIGNEVKKYPHLIKAEADEGHSVGNHTMSHANLSKISLASAMTEIRGCHKLIFKTIGFVDPFFRFPGGNSNDKILAELKQQQLPNFYWKVDTRDWATPNVVELIQNATKMIDAAGRGIVLMHDRKQTALALRSILERMQAKKYKLVLFQPLDPATKTHHPLLD